MVINSSSPTTLVMGILNITPDSFADGGKYLDLKAAAKRAQQMMSEQVDIIDIGGESTRPGAQRITAEEEARRVIPILKEVLELGATVSVDTTRAEIAEAAINLGAQYINDVSGGLADANMAKVIADSGSKYIAMHWRGHSATMMDYSQYSDVVSEVKLELTERIDALMNTGVKKKQIIIDPGIGFSKLPVHNWEILRRLDELQELKFPVLIGASRKKFLGEHLAPEERETASVSVTSFCTLQEVWGVRTHSVAPHKEAIARIEKLRAAHRG